MSEVMSAGFEWLEDSESTKVQAWARNQTRQVQDALGSDSRFEPINSQLLRDCHAYSPMSQKIRLSRGWLYRVDYQQPGGRGELLRAKLEDQLRGDAQWHLMLDLNTDAPPETAGFVMQLSTITFAPSGRYALLKIGPGADACNIYEYDLEQCKWLENGFSLGIGKTLCAYTDDDTVLFSTTAKGYPSSPSSFPLSAARWQRGSQQTEMLFECDASNVGVFVQCSRLRNGSVAPLISRHLSVDTAEVSFVRSDGSLLLLRTPPKVGFPAVTGVVENQIVFYTRKAWNIGGQIVPPDSIVSYDLDSALAGFQQPQRVEILHSCAPNETIPFGIGIAASSSRVCVNILKNVDSHLWDFQREGERWTKRKLKPDFEGSALTLMLSTPYDDEVLFTAESLIVPPKVLMVGAADQLVEIVASPAELNPDEFEISRSFAISQDGTHIPYFMVHRKGLVPDGENPTLVHAYGGGQFSMLPTYGMPYIGAIHRPWLARGGVFVLANIRGGGEFGPSWHDQATRKNRHRVYADLFAVCETLINQKITSPRRLGFAGGSNGGLLAGVAATKRPDLFGAIVAIAPILDLLRFNRLGIGAAWIPEYGDPDDPGEAPMLLADSPFHQIQPDVSYPEIFLLVSSDDDRVHPGHARRMAAKLQDQGHRAYLYEAADGGHALAKTPEDRAYIEALILMFLVKVLCD